MMTDFEIPEDVPAPIDLHPCNICGRKFVEEALQRHGKICAKNSGKKRKVFDTAKKRVEGLEIVNVPPPDPKKIQRAKQATANWRDKHEDLVSTLRAARGVTRAMRTGGPLPPPPSQTRVNPDYVQCPSCQRNFSENAADRHIPWCKEKNKRISPDKKMSNKERVAIRTQYKPPMPGAKKRQIVPPKTGAPLRTGRSEVDTAQLQSQYQNMNMNNDKTGGYGTVNGSKTRSANLERRLPKSKESYRSSSGDALRGKSRYSDEDEDYARDVSDRYGRNRFGSNSILPHQRVRPSKGQSFTDSKTPTPPARTGNKLHNKGFDNGGRASKFCHECGTQYPVAHAKYCCECGTRRAMFD